MARISAQVPDELVDEIEARTDYPDRLKSDVIRSALETYVDETADN